MKKIARHCPSLRKVVWNLASPRLFWRGVINHRLPQTEMKNQIVEEDCDVEMYLELLDKHTCMTTYPDDTILKKILGFMKTN